MNQTKVQYMVCLCNMAKKLSFLFMLLLLFSAKSKSQSCLITTPDLENINSEDNLPANSFIGLHREVYDVMILYSTYSNWISSDHWENILAHKNDGWYRIKVTLSYLFSDSTMTNVNTKKMNCVLADSLFNILRQNHLFIMQDERTVKIQECQLRIFDGSNYQFEIFSGNKYKKLSFYEPFVYEEQCPGLIERKQIVNCINAFEKYLGN